MDNQQPTPPPQNDIDARIMAERHAADAYNYNKTGVTPRQPVVAPRTLYGVAQKKAALLVIVPLVFLAGIISVASRDSPSGDKAHKSNVASADESQSSDGSIAQDYVVGQDTDTTGSDTSTSSNNDVSGSTNESAGQSTTKTTSNSSTKPKPSKPRPPIKHQPPVIIQPHKPIIIGGPPTAPPPKPTPAPTPAPVKLGTLCYIKDRGLNEASGLVASIKHPGIVYTHNDEGIGKGKGLIYAVNISTCKVVAKITVSGLRSDPDPESITIDRTTGKMWFGDIGNGHPNQPKSMTDKKPALKYPSLPARIVVFDEPSQLKKSITITRVKAYNVIYAGGMQNSEALLVNPRTGQGYIINKQATSTIYTIPKPFLSGKTNTARKTKARIPGWVTDATFTNSGRWVLIRYRTPTVPAPTNVLVYDVTTWKKVGSIKVPKVKQGESIMMEKSGRTFLIGSEGTNSPLVRVALPAKYK